jgi:hypothetical protein
MSLVFYFPLRDLNNFKNKELRMVSRPYLTRNRKAAKIEAITSTFFQILQPTLKITVNVNQLFSWFFFLPFFIMNRYLLQSNELSFFALDPDAYLVASCGTVIEVLRTGSWTLVLVQRLVQRSSLYLMLIFHANGILSRSLSSAVAYMHSIFRIMDVYCSSVMRCIYAYYSTFV